MPHGPTGTRPDSVPGNGAGRSDRDDNISVFAVANALLRERRVIVGFILVGMALGVTYGLLAGRRYAATSTFVTQSEGGNAGRLAGIAAQFGVAVDAGGQAESPEFFASLLQSRALLVQAVQSEYAVPASEDAPGDSVRGTLIRHFGLAEKPPERQLPLAVRELSKRVSARADLRTGIISLVTVAKSPHLAEAINLRLLDLLTEFNLATRRSQAQAERQFIEARVGEAQRELRQAERDLQGFLTRNRRYEDSPQLRFEHTRLEREVSLRQQVYESLARSFEDARIDEVRNTPVVTLIDRPVGSAERTGLGRAGAGLIGLMLGVILGISTALIRQYLRQRGQVEENAYEEFVELRGELADTLLPSRWFRSRGARRTRVS